MKPVTKTIKRRNANGVMVNYGNLAVGIRNGVKCLGCKEGLLLLGIRLVKEKVPERFVTHKKLYVWSGRLPKIDVYAFTEEDLPRLAYSISSYGVTVKLVEGSTILTVWEDGTVIYDICGTPKDSGKQSKPKKPKRLPWWQRVLAKFR